MSGPVFCPCGEVLFRPELDPPDQPLVCPSCGAPVVEEPVSSATAHAASAAPAAVKQPSIMRRMIESLLDANTIRRLLSLGGSLFVIGLVIWLVSLGVFDNKLVLAATLGVSSLTILGSGWLTTLKTRYRLAGQAITFLGCVVLPLNLWFYHAQDLVRIDQNLWVGGVACVLLYVATVFYLRDPLFMFAVEVGITLTMLLLLGDLNVYNDLAWLSTALAILAACSINARAAFSAESEATFSRQRFGMPLFWSGHVQLLMAVVVLVLQAIGMAQPKFAEAFQDNLGIEIPSTLWVTVGTWLVAAATNFYSDRVVGRKFGFLHLAAFCVLGAIWTGLDRFELSAEHQTTAFAVVGVGVLVAGRMADAIRPGRAIGSGLIPCGNAIVTVSLISMFVQGVMQLSASPQEWPNTVGMISCCANAVVAGLLNKQSGWKRWYLVAAVALASLTGTTMALRSTLSVYRKIEIGSVVVGAFLVIQGYIGRFREQRNANTEMWMEALWIGSLMVSIPLLIAAGYNRMDGVESQMLDEIAIVAASLLLLTTGVGWQVKATTFFGGGTLATYLLMIVGVLAYRPNLAAGAYLAIGGGVLFVLGIMLSVYRERLLRLPESIANREGMFKILDWR